MYVGRSHTATVTTKNILSFTCALCGHKADALVIGVGQGKGQSPFMLDESGAKNRAATGAETAARKNATETLKLARCPKCSRRDEKALTSMKAKVIAGAVAILIGFPLVGLVIDAAKSGHSNVFFGVFVVAAPITAWLVYRQQSWKWTTIDNRVAFLKEDESEKVAAALAKANT